MSDPVSKSVRPCRQCRGSGVDPDYHRRFTSGGHDERPCQDCGGTGERIEDEQDLDAP